MSTMLSMLIAFMACLIGLIAIAAGILFMGFAGAPGALIYEIGKKKDNFTIRTIGIGVAGVAQAFVVASYSVLAVSLLHWLVASHPSLPAWPLWIAAAFHSFGLPAHAVKDRAAANTPQYRALPFASLAAIVTFTLTIVSPSTLQPIFEWIPGFKYILQSSEPVVTAASTFPEWLT